MCILAALDCVDAKDAGALFGKADAEVADAEPHMDFIALKCLDATGARFRQTVNGGEDVHGDVLGDGSDLVLGLLRHDDPLQAAESFS